MSDDPADDRPPDASADQARMHFLNETIDMLLYQQLSTMAGGEIVSIPDQ